MNKGSERTGGGQRSYYQAKRPDQHGIIHYSQAEDQRWMALLKRQLHCIAGKACDEFMQGLDCLNLPTERIPQLSEINPVLQSQTGWQVVASAGLLSFERFFQLLAARRFPVATFIRSAAEFDYLQQPDVFHEIFGHCPLLTNPNFADFTQHYGELGLLATPIQRQYLARLYWFTVEFGLVNSIQGRRIYGGGILSSPAETRYALSSEPEHRPLVVMDVMRMPYRIDIMQPVYFVLADFEKLFALAQMDLLAQVNRAIKLGLFMPKSMKIKTH